LVPVFAGKRGHPVILDLARYRVEIEGLTGEKGLKPVVRGHPDDTLELTIEDERILRDLDTPEDYERELALMRKSDSKDAS
jgi:molybdenum cofactor cytidylyltransferase